MQNAKGKMQNWSWMAPARLPARNQEPATEVKRKVLRPDKVGAQDDSPLNVWVGRTDN
jgi:hypothetical protein